MLFQLRYVAHF